MDFVVVVRGVVVRGVVGHCVVGRDVGRDVALGAAIGVGIATGVVWLVLSGDVFPPFWMLLFERVVRVARRLILDRSCRLCRRRDRH